MLHFSLQVSEVVGLPVRCDRSWSNVLQAYGPMWALYTDKDQCAMVLKETFLNAFKYADTVLQIRSLATPAISAGMYAHCIYIFAIIFNAYAMTLLL